MTVDKKYTELPARRKASRKAASACAVLAALRTLWCVAVPTAAGAAFPATTTLAVAAAALAASLLRAAGAGFGAPHRERPTLLALHAGVGSAALVATQLAALAVDHFVTPLGRRRPAQLVAALSSFSSSSFPARFSPAAVEALEKVVEGSLDAALLVAAVASAVAGRRYLSMKRAK